MYVMFHYLYKYVKKKHTHTCTRTPNELIWVSCFFLFFFFGGGEKSAINGANDWKLWQKSDLNWKLSYLAYENCDDCDKVI